MRSYTIGEIWDIPIRINTSLIIFLPILAWLIGSGTQIELYAGLIEGLTGIGFEPAPLRAGMTPWIIGIAAAVGLFASVTLHELGHSWVAIRYGIEIESITLWILGGIASLKSLPKEWNREFWIAIAGPITSVLVAGVCYVGVVIVGTTLPIPGFILGWLAVTNVTLAVFNLLPAFPMDGGRIFRALLARKRPYGVATRIAARVGVGFAFLFAIVGVLNFQLLLLLLALFIYGAATTESRTVLLDELLEDITVGDIMTASPPSVSASLSLADFGDQLIRDRETVHLVTDEAGTFIGVIALEDLKQKRPKKRDELTVGDLARSTIRIDATADAFDTLATFQESGAGGALIESDGELVGVLTPSDYSRAMAIRQAI